MKRPPFITVEGVDGAGKSSHLKLIVSELEQSGYKVLLVREPGGTNLGEKLRDMLLHDAMDGNAEILLAFASRTQLLTEKIIPALNSGIAVVCDRFTDSTYAYQVGGQSGDRDLVDYLANKIHGEVMPDLTLIFDLPPTVSKQRLVKTNKVPDKFESQSLEYFSRVREEYLMLAKSSSRYKVINSEHALEEVVGNVRTVMRNFLVKNEITQAEKSKMVGQNKIL